MSLDSVHSLSLCSRGSFLLRVLGFFSRTGFQTPPSAQLFYVTAAVPNHDAMNMGDGWGVS